MKFLNLFLESWKVLKDKKVFAIFGIEFLFFLLMAVNVTVSFSFIADNLNELKNFEQGFSIDENANADYIYGSLLFLSGLLNKIFVVAGISFIVSFLLFGFFTGISCKLSFNLINRKNLFKDYNAKYFFNFYFLTLIWFLIFAAAFYLLYSLGFNYWIFAVILILLFYFLWINSICFVLENKLHSSFLRSVKLSVMKFYVFVPVFFILIVFLAVSSYMFEIIGNEMVSFLGAFLGVFIFVWFRIFLMLIMREYIP